MHLHPCSHMVEPGDTGIHLCPRCRQAPPTCPALQVGTQDTQHLEAAAEGVSIMRLPAEAAIYNSLGCNKGEIKLDLTSQITSHTLLEERFHIGY